MSDLWWVVTYGLLGLFPTIQTLCWWYTHVQDSDTYRRMVVMKVFTSISLEWYLANVHLVLIESGMTATCLCHIVKCFIIFTKQTWLACDRKKKKKKKKFFLF